MHEHQWSLACALFATVVIAGGQVAPLQEGALTEVPGLHHLHMNSTAPEKAIAGYLKAYPSLTTVTTWGLPGVKAPNGVTLLFTKVGGPLLMPGPDRDDVPQSAFWHHVWNVTDVRRTLVRFKADSEFKLVPQYLGPDGAKGEVSSDGLPGFLTTAQLDAARARGAQPSHRGGYFNWYGPDGVLMETLEGPSEVYTILGMFQEQPLCAVLWYRSHLNADVPSGRGAPTSVRLKTPQNCRVERGEVSWPSTYGRGHYRDPGAEAVVFSGVSLRWYMNQSSTPLVSTRGQLFDHVALSVKSVDAWAAKLRQEGVTILEQPHAFAGARVMVIEGPSREAIELVEQR